MIKELEDLKKLAYENACCRCQYLVKKGCSLCYQNDECSCIWLGIETKLKDYDMLLEEYNLMKKEYDKKIKALDILKEKEWFDDFMKEHLTREWFTKDELELLKEMLNYGK